MKQITPATESDDSQAAVDAYTRELQSNREPELAPRAEVGSPIAPEAVRRWLEELTNEGTLTEAELTLKAEGLIDDRKRTGIDYTTSYQLQKQVQFLGSEVVAIDFEEDGVNDRGCCRSPSLGLFLKVGADTSQLEAFAAENECTVKDAEFTHEEVEQDFAEFGVSRSALLTIDKVLYCTRGS